MKKTFIPLLITLIFALVIFYGCGGKKGPKTLTAPELIDQGWTKFKAGDFSGASGDFKAALGLDSTATNYDALLGLGWTELRQNHGGLSEKAFLAYLSKVSDSNDAKGGLALAYLADDKFEDAITSANAVLSSNPDWAFSNDTNMNQLDVKLVLVQSYYETADYAQSLAAIKLYFDSSFNPGDVNTNEGRIALAKKIQSLNEGIS